MDARRRRSRRKGSAITEFAPALFLFLIVIFFPMLDMLGAAAAYCMGWYENFMACRELTVRKSNETTQVFTEVEANFNSTGFAKFIGLQNLKNTATYTPVTNGVGYVCCTTTLDAMPFISIPWFGVAPGLNAPMNFTFTSTRPREVTQ